MAKKKILKLNDEQYYRYILSLKNDSNIKNNEQETAPDTFKKSEDNKNK